MKSISRFVIIFLILSVILLYVIVNYFYPLQAGYINQIVWTGVLSNNIGKESVVFSRLQPKQELSHVQNYGGELGNQLRMYKNSMQGR
jgi:hypothetical protein